MMRTLLPALAIACATVAAATLGAQTFPLTNKLTSLEGTWVRDPARGTGGICGVNPADRITIKVSAAEIAFDAAATAGRTDRLAEVECRAPGRGAGQDRLRQPPRDCL